MSKFLHADNPWGNAKHRQNITPTINEYIPKLRELLILHCTAIRTKDFNGMWVVEVPTSDNNPRVIIGEAMGDFIINY